MLGNVHLTCMIPWKMYGCGKLHANVVRNFDKPWSTSRYE